MVKVGIVPDVVAAVVGVEHLKYIKLSRLVLLLMLLLQLLLLLLFCCCCLGGVP